MQVVDHSHLEARAQWRIEREAWEGRHRQTECDHAKERRHSHETHRGELARRVSGRDEMVERERTQQHAAVLQRQLAVLEQVVESRQHVALGSLDAVEQ